MINSFLFVAMLLNFTAEVSIFRNNLAEIVVCYINPLEDGNLAVYNIGNQKIFLSLDCDTLFKDGFE